MSGAPTSRLLPLTPAAGAGALPAADGETWASPLPDFFRIDRDTRPIHVVGMAFLAAQVDGRQPFVESFELEAGHAPSALLPPGAAIERSVTTDLGVQALARTGCATILVTVQPHAVVVHVSARTAAQAAAAAADIRARAPRAPEPDTVPVTTWHLNRQGVGVANDRRITAPTWTDIARNYPVAVRADLQPLMDLVRPEGGKLILWHGLPGTGKTTALRALMRAWEPWCTAQHVSDPERFFADPGYIAQVLTRPLDPRHGGHDRAASHPASWRLVVAEDSDEHLRASARRDAGAGLGRLLNLTDGVLGQGLNALVLVTTNEEVREINPALTRPGRSLGRVEFTAFGPSEAAAWLDRQGDLPDRDLTLAELFERRGSTRRLGTIEGRRSAPGQYL